MNDAEALTSGNDVDLIIDVTGNPSMEAMIAGNKDPRTEMLGGASSKLI